jgi:hypothetical protein
MCFVGIAFRILERGRKQMVVPGKAASKWPRPGLGLVARGSITLERGRKVISVASEKQNTRSGLIIAVELEAAHAEVVMRAPEIKVLGHVDLFEDSH